MRIIRKTDLREGRWRNGLGVSWDIATDGNAGADDFGWRLAIARIDSDVPFSHYPQVDRIFTLIDGQGLDLDFADGRTLAADQLFVPHPYPCDVPTFCRLRDGPCRVLNLFLKRRSREAEVDILSSNADITHPGPILAFVLKGPADMNGVNLETGDTAVTDERISIVASGALVYAARLTAI
jgi:environmental stress-induced protein Ves